MNNYLDPDAMFTYPMDFTPFEQHDGCWHGSDTRSYTEARHIRDKGERFFVELGEIPGVSPIWSWRTTTTQSARSTSSRTPARTSGSTWKPSPFAHTTT